jgi:hypothetical protein
MIYIFTNKDGVKIEAKLEVWGWGVVYKDKTELRQFGNDGVFHQFADIKQDEVAMFVMEKTDESGKRIDMAVEGKQVFHFYRNIVLNMLTPEQRKIRVYCFGWKDRETGATSYNFILPDDRVVIGDRDLDLTKFGI